MNRPPTPAAPGARRVVAGLLALQLGLLAVAPPAQAGWIDAAEAAATPAPAAPVAAAGSARDRLHRLLDREDVVRGLRERGVTADEARARVAALSDDEAARVAARIDSDPAGASDVLGVVVFVFVLLLVTDILGFTKVFPFTRSVR